MRKTLTNIPQCLDWDRVISGLPTEDGTEAAEDKRAHLWTLVSGADDGIGSKRKQIIAKIGEKVIDDKVESCLK